MLLKGKTAIITGASRGIGKGIAEVFSKNGANLIITARGDEVKEVAATLSSDGVKAIAVQGDMKDDAHIKEIVKTCKSEFGTADILVNNAGILDQSLLGMIPADSIDELYKVNVTSVINLTQYVIRIMGQSKSPSIINISSVLGTQGGSEGVSVYSSTKTALIGFTKSAAKELAPKNIRVNAIAPGLIETDLLKDLPAEKRNEYINNIRMGRIGVPEDVAGCALFLASDLSSYVTGQTIEVDGGIKV